jgi:hypothetical protein
MQDHLFLLLTLFRTRHFISRVRHGSSFRPFLHAGSLDNSIVVNVEPGNIAFLLKLKSISQADVIMDFRSPPVQTSLFLNSYSALVV